MTYCENHPDREGRLAVDLPSIGVKRYLCEECVSKLGKTLLAVFSNVEVWQRELSQGFEDRRVDMLDAYPGRPLRWKHGNDPA